METPSAAFGHRQVPLDGSQGPYDAPSDPHAARLDLERLAELAESGECCVLHNYTLEALVAEIRSLRAEVADLKDEMAGMIPIEQA